MKKKERDHKREYELEKERIRRFNVKLDKNLYEDFLEKLNKDTSYKDRTDWLNKHIKKYLEKF